MDEQVTELLEELEQDFQGFNWRPLDFLPYYYLKLLLRNVEDFHKKLEPLNFRETLGGAKLDRNRFLMLLEIKKAKRWQYRDNVTFMKHLTQALGHAREIIERLKKLRSVKKI